jgi:hypothetical protein
MKKLNVQISFLLALSLLVFMVLSCSKIKDMFSEKDKTTKEETTKEETKETTKSEDKTESTSVKTGNRLYFCEDYLQKEEVNVSDRFSTGRLTVMVKTKEKLYDVNVSLKLEKLNDDGTYDFVKTIKFEIPIGDYFFFKHKDLGFSKPGVYRVTLLGLDKKPVCSGNVTIIP